MKLKTCTAKVKAGPEDGLEEGQFLVYPSTFTRTPDSYGDVVAPGAFLDTIKAWEESGNTLPGLFGHRLDDPDFYVASALEMGEDEHGWWVKGEFDMESPKGPQVHRLVKGGRLNQLSFAFDIEDEGQVELEDGVKANELRKLKVYEFSFVPIGANQDTSVVAIKSLVAGLAAGAELKAGRVLSAKNEVAVREARDLLDAVLKTLGSEDDGETQDDQEQQASGHAGAKAEEPSGANAKEPQFNPSASLRTEFEFLALGQ